MWQALDVVKQPKVAEALGVDVGKNSTSTPRPHTGGKDNGGPDTPERPSGGTTPEDVSCGMCSFLHRVVKLCVVLGVEWSLCCVEVDL